jgi:hypothetical protein
LSTRSSNPPTAQTEGEQQQDHADLGAGGDELLAGGQGQDSAVAEGQAGQQVQRNRGDPEPDRQCAEQTEAEQDGAEFDQQQ